MFKLLINLIKNWGLGIGDWGLPNPQSPIPNPQLKKFKYYRTYRLYSFKYTLK